VTHVQRLTVALGLVAALAAPASAGPILPTNLDVIQFGIGTSVASNVDLFDVASPPPNTMGTLFSEVFFDGTTYTYLSLVTPSVLDASHLNTAFTIAGFTGEIGWSFGQAAAAGGTGTALDFLTGTFADRAHWLALDRGLGENWDAGEPIAFFFRSTKPPTIGDYNLLNGEAGTAEGFAPVPEPGTLALLGTGLYGLYRTRKRQRAQQREA
jgi:PEP-CTERM motif